MTNREIIERVHSEYQKGAPSDNSRLSYRHIYSKLSSIRSQLLQQLASKRKILSERNIEYLECIQLEQAEPYDCPCAPPSGCVILKSKCKIPRPITTKYGDYIQGVTSIDGSDVYSKTSWVAKAKKKGNKYTTKTKDFFFKNDYLYITTPSAGDLTTTVVTVSGIFTDSTDFNCDYCKECNEENLIIDCTSNLDKEFRIDPELEFALVEMTVKSLLEKFRLPGTDLLNNAQDDISLAQHVQPKK